MGVYVIAEAGVNHNGNDDMAIELVDVAVAAEADAIKFQTFVPDQLATARAEKAEYQKSSTGESGNQLKLLEHLVLSADMHHRLKDKCSTNNIDFLSTPFDLPSVQFLTADIGLTTLKIPSGEITHGALLLAAARSGSDIIMSTGMASLEEISDALAVLAFGYFHRQGNPNLEEARDLSDSSEGKAILKNKVSLLHCTTEYPAPIGEINLRAIDTLKNTFGLTIGYSDHTSGIIAPVAAVARGAEIIEKHFTLSHSLTGPDHKASLEPEALIEMVANIRLAELALGDGKKEPMPSELKNLGIARKSLHAACNITRGEVFTEVNLTAKRPNTGITPMFYWQMLGRKATRDYHRDDLIDPL